jgi:site-specific recombinase XerD
MKEELLTLLDRLSPSNQRLLRELIFKLAQLEQITTPEEHDATLDYAAQLDPWLMRLVNRGLSHHTIRNYGSYLRHFLARYPHPRRTHIDAFLAEATARGMQPSSLTQVINALKSFFNYLTDVEAVSTNIASRIERPHLQRLIRLAPNVDHVARVLEASKSLRHQAMLELLVDCGLRCEELVTICISKIDLENKLLTVMGKGKKERQVPLSPAVARTVSCQIGEIRSVGYDGDWLFPGQVAGDHVNTDSVRDYLRRLCRHLELQKITPHQLRHYFATQMLSSGANLKATSTMLGHKKTSTTVDIYWHVLNQKEILDQHAKYSPLGDLYPLLFTNVTPSKKREYATLVNGRDVKINNKHVDNVDNSS